VYEIKCVYVNNRQYASNGVQVILGSMRTEKRRKSGYLLPVVSICTGRQVRLAPPSCCPSASISFICTCTSAKQSDCLPTASLYRHTNIDYSHLFRVSTLEINLILRLFARRILNGSANTKGRARKRDINRKRAIASSRKPLIYGRACVFLRDLSARFLFSCYRAAH